MSAASLDLANNFNIKNNYQKFEKVVDNIYKGER